MNEVENMYMGLEGDAKGKVLIDLLSRRDYAVNPTIHDRILYLISPLADSNFFIRNKAGETALHLAIKNNWPKHIIEFLITAKTWGGPEKDLLEVICDLKITPLVKSIIVGNVSIVHLLIEGGANVNSTFGPYEKTPIFYAITAPDRDITIMEKLAKHGADINFQDAFGNTPLMCAVENLSPITIMEKLLQLGADPRIINRRTGESFISLLEKRFGKNIPENITYYLKTPEDRIFKRTKADPDKLLEIFRNKNSLM